MSKKLYEKELAEYNSAKHTFEFYYGAVMKGAIPPVLNAAIEKGQEVLRQSGVLATYSQTPADIRQGLQRERSELVKRVYELLNMKRHK